MMMDSGAQHTRAMVCVMKTHSRWVIDLAVMCRSLNWMPKQGAGSKTLCAKRLASKLVKVDAVLLEMLFFLSFCLPALGKYNLCHYKTYTCLILADEVASTSGALLTSKAALCLSTSCTFVFRQPWELLCQYLVLTLTLACLQMSYRSGGQLHRLSLQ